MIKIPKGVQLSKHVIHDIIQDSSTFEDCKMLVFGLGNDSIIWNKITNGNTVFIENYQKWIDLNKNIPKNNIIKYDYGNVTVESSLKNIKDTDFIFNEIEIPEEVLKRAPYDIILIDGPQGYKPEFPGRLYPIQWSLNNLSKKGTYIYIDDMKRPLEHKSVEKFLKSSHKIIKTYPDRGTCIKIEV